MGEGTAEVVGGGHLDRCAADTPGMVHGLLIEGQFQHVEIKADHPQPLEAL